MIPTRWILTAILDLQTHSLGVHLMFLGEVIHLNFVGFATVNSSFFKYFKFRFDFNVDFFPHSYFLLSCLEYFFFEARLLSYSI